MSLKTLSCWSLMDATVQTLSYPSKNPLTKSTSLQFGEKDVMGDHVKGLTEVQINYICNLSLLHQCNHSIKEVKFHFLLFFCALRGYSDPSEHQSTASSTTSKNSPQPNSFRPWIAAIPTIWAIPRAGQGICSWNIWKEICCVTVGRLELQCFCCSDSFIFTGYPLELHLSTLC